jgi:hypothetical protein
MLHDKNFEIAEDAEDVVKIVGGSLVGRFGGPDSWIIFRCVMTLVALGDFCMSENL